MKNPLAGALARACSRRRPAAVRFAIAGLGPVALVVACAAAQDRVPPLRALREMEIAGTAAFDRDRIACALVADEATLRALRRPLAADVAAEVAERVEELHLRGGYADAMARGGIVNGTLRIELKAGQRFRCGEVRCTGNSVLTTEQIRAALAEKGEKRVSWTPGEFARLGDAAVQRVVATVGLEYQKVGRHGVATEVRFVREGETLVLDVAVSDEGHEVRIQSLSLDGEDDAHRAAVLGAVQFTPGMLATREAMHALSRQFLQTGRYAGVRFDLPEQVPAVLDPLKVVVKVRPDAAELDQVAARDAAQLRSAFDLAQARLQEGVPIQVTLAIPTEMRWGRLRLQPGSVVFTISKDGFAATAEHVVVGDATSARASAVLTADELTIAFGERTGRWVFDRPISLQIQMTSNLGDQGAEVRWGLGIGLGIGDPGTRMIAVDVHPGTAAYLLTQASEVRRDGDEIAVLFGDTRVRLGAKGDVVGDRVELGDGLTIALRSAPFAEQRRSILPATATEATPDAAIVLLDIISAIVADVMAPAAKQDERVHLLLRSCVGPVVVPEQRQRTMERVAMPALADSEPSMATMLAMIAAVPAVDRGFRGRLVDLSAAFAPLLQGDAGSAGAGFEAMSANKEHGPLSLAIAALLLRAAGIERASASFAQAAADRLGFDAFYADAADLGINTPFLAVVPPQVVARWRAQPELREMFADLPDGEAGDLAAWRKGLELLWNAGGERLLREALSAK